MSKHCQGRSEQGKCYRTPLTCQCACDGCTIAVRNEVFKKLGDLGDAADVLLKVAKVNLSKLTAVEKLVQRYKGQRGR